MMMKKYIGMLIVTLCLAFVGQSKGSLLTDPGFEANNPDVGWGFLIGAGLFGETGPSSVSGDGLSMELTPGVDASYTQIIAKAVPIASDQFLNLTLDYKQLAGGSGNIVVQTRYYAGVSTNGFSEGGGGTLLGENTRTLPPSIGVWNTYSTGSLANSWPAADYVEVRIIGNAFGIPQAGSTLVDNIELIAVPLLINPGFEVEGGGGVVDADGWHQTDTNIVQRNGPVGEAGHGDWRMLFSDTVNALHWASQTLVATPGDTYTATADFQAILESGEVAFIWLGFLDSGGGEIGSFFTTYETGQADYADSVWVSRSIAAVAPTGTVQVSVRAMSHLNGNGTSSILADNVVLQHLLPAAGAVTNATITVIPAAELPGDSGDLFQNATVTTNSSVHPTRNIADLFTSGSPIGPEDMIFADNNGTILSFVDFNISGAVHLTNLVLYLQNGYNATEPDQRSITRATVYAGLSSETVMSNMIAYITVDPEYTDAYGGAFLKLSIDLDANARYFRIEFEEPKGSTVDWGARVWEIDGYGGSYVEPLYPATILSWSSISNNIMRMVVDAPSSADRYSPASSMNLALGSWVGVPHSDDGLNAFTVTNLGYSTAEGTNEVIYVEAADPVEFFRIIGE